MDKWIVRSLVLLVIFGGLMGCQTSSKNTRSQGKTAPKGETTPRVTEGDQKDPMSEKSGEISSEVTYEVAPSTPATPPNSFVTRKAPRVGVILGGGGVLTYAHIGLLREFKARKIAIHHIAGLEWGAMVAGIYSMSGRPHEAEWQMLKIPFQKFDKQGVFSGSRSVDVTDFRGYLSGVFQKKKVENAKIPFSCPYMEVARGRVRVQDRGSYRNVVRYCWPFMPKFNAAEYVASPFSIAETAKAMRKKGIELVVYIDVLDKNIIFNGKERKADPWAHVLWNQVRAVSKNPKELGVDEVISIPLAGSSYSNYKSMRLLIRLGQLKSRSSVQKLAKKYGI